MLLCKCVCAFIEFLCRVWVALVPFQGLQKSRDSSINKSSESVRQLQGLTHLKMCFLLHRLVRKWVDTRENENYLNLLGEPCLFVDLLYLIYLIKRRLILLPGDGEMGVSCHGSLGGDAMCLPVPEHSRGCRPLTWLSCCLAIASVSGSLKIQQRQRGQGLPAGTWPQSLTKFY